MSSDPEYSHVGEERSAPLICCTPAEIAVNSLFVCVWGLFASVLQLLQTLFISWPVRMLTVVIKRQRNELGAGLFVGLGFAHLVFLPIARSVTTEYPNKLCTSYVCLLSWSFGALCTALAVDTRVIRPMALPCVKQASRWYRAMSSGSWIGFIVGLSFAFQLTTIVRTTDDSYIAFEEWCRPHDEVPVVYVAIPCLFIGAVGGLAALDRADWFLKKRPKQQQAQNKKQRRRRTPGESRNHHRDIEMAYVTHTPPSRSASLFYHSGDDADDCSMHEVVGSEML